MATLHETCLTNPKRTNFDMAVFKHFAITESMGFEFRAEAFNVFNHIEYAWLGGDSGSAASNSPFASSNNVLTCYGVNNSAGDPSCTAANAYLRPAVAHNGRILQLGAKFIFFASPCSGAGQVVRRSFALRSRGPAPLRMTKDWVT